MRKKAWLAVSIGMGLSFSLVALLVLATYMVASKLPGGGSGGSVRLVEGSVPAEYVRLVEEHGNRCPAINPALLAAQLYQESGWNPKAVSPANARGLAQFIPGTWDAYGVDGDGDGDRDIWDPVDAIPSAAAYDCALAKYVKGVPGDPTHNMLASYNAGSYAVIKYNGVPPYNETQNYVQRITTLAKSFAAPTRPVAASKQAAAAIYFAQKQLGKDYLWGGNGTPDQDGRFDCSGLTKAAYATVGIKLPRVANDQWNAGPHPSRDELQPGDLVFFAYDLQDPRSIHHVGIYVGGGKMINAPYTGAVIRYDDIDSPDYIGATRVTKDGANALPTPQERAAS